jgi:hypothetical protein
MAHTLTVLTLELAQAIGLYILFAGLGLLVAPGKMAAIVADMEASPGLTYAFGIAAFAIGVAILIPHHVLYDWLSVVVTVIAVIAAVEGLLLLAVPKILFAVARGFLAAERLWAIVAIVAGLILFLAGFTGRADALP